MEYFDYKQFLIENRLTSNSRLLEFDKNNKIFLYPNGIQYYRFNIIDPPQSEFMEYIISAKDGKIYNAVIEKKNDSYVFRLDEKYESLFQKFNIDYKIDTDVRKIFGSEIRSNVFVIPSKYIVITDKPRMEKPLTNKDINKIEQQAVANYKKLLDNFEKNGIKVVRDTSQTQYLNNWRKLKIQSNDVYDFGGAEFPIDNSVVVDIDPPEESENKNNEFIEQDLEQIFSLPPKPYINISSVLHFINNKQNLAKSIDNSLTPGGILVIKSNINEMAKMLPYIKYKIVDVYISSNAEEYDYESVRHNDDIISITFKK